MEGEKIKEILQNIFDKTPDFPKKRHIVFWYDEGGAFKECLSELNLNNAKTIILNKIENKNGELVDNNIFKTKYTLEVEDTESNYLIYSKFPRPKKQENFLLDIEEYSESFIADRTSMIIEEFSLDRLDRDTRDIVEKYNSFFSNKERKERLTKLLETLLKVDAKNIEIGILAVLSNTKSFHINDILKNIIIDESRLEQIEKWMGTEYLYEKIKENFAITVDSFEKFIKYLVVIHFYREVAEKPHANLENYYTGNTHELYLFADSLLENKNVSQLILDKFHEIGKELMLKEKIDSLELEKIVQGTGFEYFDIVTIKEIAEKLSQGLSEFNIYRNYINVRLDNTLWKEKYINFYKGLLAAIAILELKKRIVIQNEERFYDIFNKYTNEYYKIDRAYREFFYSYDKGKSSEINGVFDKLEDNISNFYERDYLEPLLKVWSSHLKNRETISSQKNFYKNHVKKSDTRVAVIISDALRYEIAVDIKEKLLKVANTKEVKLESMISEFPSITSIGMGNLLPHKDKISYNLKDDRVTINGNKIDTIENRENILKMEEEASSAISFNNFKNFHRAEQEEYIKGKKVIYIYHDRIDALGDKMKTESSVFEACDLAVSDIIDISKLLSSIGVVNIFITSDHGFIYERREVEEHDKLELENEYSVMGKRYALSPNKYEERGCITLPINEYYGIFPEKNQRIKSMGGGLQFVHGGISPQETVIPLIKYRSGVNATKSKKVDVKLRESIGKITSSLSKFGIYQIEPVNVQNKIIERAVGIALYSLTGERVSNEEKIMLNSTTENKLYDFKLTLSGEHKKVILKVLDLDSGDTLDSKEYEVNLSIASDFDF